MPAPSGISNALAIYIPRALFNVKNFGAVGDGVTDDKAAIQATIAAAQAAGGGTVYLPDSPAGAYNLKSGLTISLDNIALIAESWNAQLKADATFPAANYLLTVQQPGGGVFRYGILIRDVFFNGNSVTGLGGCLDIQTCYAALIEHCRIRFWSGICVHLDGTSGNVGAYNYLSHNHISDGVGNGCIGLQTDFCEWNTIEANEFSFFQTNGTSIGIHLQNLNNRVIGNSIDNNDIGVQDSFGGRNVIMGNEFDRAWTYFVYLRGSTADVVADNSFNSQRGTAADVIHVSDTNAAHNLIVGNVVMPASGMTNFANEIANTGGPNTYTNNDTGGLPILAAGTNNPVQRQNIGINPKGSIAAPAFPATTVGVVNTTGYDVTANIANGTSAITAISIAGVNGTYNTTGLQIAASGWGSVRIPAGAGVKFTYAAGTPTWTWFAD